MTASESMARRALLEYPVGEVRSLTRIPQGLIHLTWRAETDRGVWILQRLHPDMAGDDGLQDFAAVTEALAARNFPAPRLVRTTSGRPALDGTDGRYRLITRLEGATVESVSDLWMAREAARLLGEFHRALAEFRYAFTRRRALHDSPVHFDAFRKAVGRVPPEAPEALIRRIETELPRWFLPAPIPSRVVHGDPKINNVLFDIAARKAVGLVDLDSCARHSVLVDLGDAARSWCRSGPEDAEAPFEMDRFQAILEGYRESGAPVSAAERELLVRACLLIPLELASRFVRDAFEDRYFGWDPARFPSRPAHNLARARGMTALYDSMLARKGEMEKQVRVLWGNETYFATVRPPPSFPRKRESRSSPGGLDSRFRGNDDLNRYPI
ncbi:phosphotransferase [bacterium]|nr:phosphotransferase [bacterium]